MYVGLFVHSAVVLHVFMFYVGLLIVADPAAAGPII